jgi:hypothetical protein
MSSSSVGHTDELTPLGWSKASETVVAWIDDPNLDVIEGVTTLRALRKWLRKNIAGRPCDKLVYLRGSFEELNRGQVAMTRGCWSVFQQIRPYLQERGVAIEVRDKCA